MIASVRGVAILTLVAIALAITVIVDRPDEPTPVARELVPGLDPAAVTTLRFDRPGQPAIELVRDAAGWQMRAPSAGPADPVAVADVLSTLAVARSQRRAEASSIAVTPPKLTITIDALAPIHIGAPIGSVSPDDSGAPRWWTQGNAAALVDGWVAQAVDRDVAALRLTRPFPVRGETLTGIEMHGPGLTVALGGAAEDVQTAQGPVVLDRTRGAQLLATLDALRATAFPDAAPTGEPALRIVVSRPRGAAELQIFGACPIATPAPTRWVAGVVGSACVTGAPIDELVAIARQLAGDPAAWVEARPVAGELARLTLADGAVLHRRGQGWELQQGGTVARADEAAARRITDALRRPGQVVALDSAAASAAAGRPVEIDLADGTHQTLAWAPATRRLRRGTEPVAIEVAPDVAAVFSLAAPDVRDRTLWVDDATNLDQVVVTVGGERQVIERGATIGEWTSASGAVDVAAMATLASAVAAPSVIRFDASGSGTRGPKPEARGPLVELRFAAPPVAGGAPSAHTIALGRVVAGQPCTAVVDGQGAVLAAETCAALNVRLVSR